MKEKHHMVNPERDALTTIAKHAWRGAIWIKPKGEGPRHIKTPLTHQHLDAHLDGSGPAIGLAPITPGTSTTRLGLLDFDSHKGEVAWPEMLAEATRVASVLRADGYAPNAFRSTGGAGIHLLLLLDADVEARDVRTYLIDVLGRCGFKAGTGGVRKREVEVFPKQDRVPADGAGSMFVLPFSGKSERLTLDEELF